jgi:hypothetical protein
VHAYRLHFTKTQFFLILQEIQSSRKGQGTRDKGHKTQNTSLNCITKVSLVVLITFLYILLSLNKIIIAFSKV